MDMNSDIYSYISSLGGIVEARKFWDLAVAFFLKKAESVSKVLELKNTEKCQSTENKGLKG
jgi:hypothetical protein